MKKNMKIYQENKEKIEDYLFIITVLIFVISTIANAPHMFSPAGEATLWGAIVVHCGTSFLATTTHTTTRRTKLLFSEMFL